MKNDGKKSPERGLLIGGHYPAYPGFPDSVWFSNADPSLSDFSSFFHNGGLKKHLLSQHVKY